MNVLPFAVLVSGLVAENGTAGLQDVVAVGNVIYGVNDTEISVFTLGAEGGIVRGVSVPVGDVKEGVASAGYVCAWSRDHVAVLDVSAPETPQLAYNLTLSDEVTDVGIDDDNTTLYILTTSSMLSLNLSDSKATPAPFGPALPPNVSALAIGASRIYYSTPTALLAYDVDTGGLDTYPQDTAYTYLEEIGDGLLLGLTENSTAVLLRQFSPAESFAGANTLAVLPTEGLIAAFGEGYVYRLNMTLDVLEATKVPSNATRGTVLIGESGPTFIVLSPTGVVVVPTSDPNPVDDIPSQTPADFPVAGPALVRVTATSTMMLPEPRGSSNDDDGIALLIIIPVLCAVAVLCCGYSFYMYRKGREQPPSFDEEQAVLQKGDVDAEMSPVKARNFHSSPSFSPALGPGHAPAPPPVQQDRGYAEGGSGRSTPVAQEAGFPQAALPPLAKRSNSFITREEQPVEIDISYSHFRAGLGVANPTSVPVAPLSPSLASPLLPEATASPLREGSPRGSEYNERSPFYSPPVIPSPPDQHGVILDTHTGRIVMSVRGSPTSAFESPQKNASPMAAPPADLLKELDITPVKDLPKVEKGGRDEHMALIRAKHEENERLDKILELARVGYDVGGLL